MSEIGSYHDTIFALSSGRLPSGVAVIRISGPKTRFVYETICQAIPEPRHAALLTFRSRNGDAIDRGLTLFSLLLIVLLGKTAPNFICTAVRPLWKRCLRCWANCRDAELRRLVNLRDVLLPTARWT